MNRDFGLTLRVEMTETHIALPINLVVQLVHHLSKWLSLHSENATKSSALVAHHVTVRLAYGYTMLNPHQPVIQW